MSELSTPISPPSGPAQRLFQEPPAKSKFLAVLNDKPDAGRRKRGSRPRVMEIDLKHLWLTKADVTTEESVIDDILRKLPIADFSGTPDKVGYKVKAWLMSQLQARKGT